VEAVGGSLQLSVREPAEPARRRTDPGWRSRRSRIIAIAIIIIIIIVVVVAVAVAVVAMASEAEEPQIASSACVQRWRNAGLSADGLALVEPEPPDDEEEEEEGGEEEEEKSCGYGDGSDAQAPAMAMLLLLVLWQAPVLSCEVRWALLSDGYGQEEASSRNRSGHGAPEQDGILLISLSLSLSVSQQD
jgi:hypothetical protein